MGRSGYIAHGDYRIVGSDTVGLAHVDAAMRGGRSGQIILALGPRTGSAAKALRLGRMDNTNRMRPPPGHHPSWSKHHHHHVYFHESRGLYGQMPLFCDYVLAVPESVSRVESTFGCPGAIKEGGRTKAWANQIQ
jgi:hypothetical protein